MDGNRGADETADRTAHWTETARASLRYAEDESRGRNHDYVGQEHLLLGLVRADESTAMTVLRALNVDLDVIRTEIDLMIGRAAIAPARRSYTPRLQAALDLAAGEAEGFEHARVDSGHLLLGILREGQGVGADLLKARGLTLNAARDQVLRLHAAGIKEQ